MADTLAGTSNRPIQRKLWVDGLRALCMIFVIFGHQTDSVAYDVFTCPIKLPLFFMITGYVFNEGKTTGAFFKNLFFKMIIPWLCLTVPLFVLYTPFKGISYLWDCIYKTISGELFWYMPCCIIAEIIWYCVRRLLGGGQIYLTCVAAVVLMIIGLILQNYGILNFAMFNHALMAQGWILMGFLYKRFSGQINELKWMPPIGLGILYLAMAFVSLKIWPGQAIDVRMNVWYNYPYNFAMILIGCFAIFMLAEKLGKTPKFMVFIGQNTLVYYLLHQRMIGLFVSALSFVHVTVPDNMVGTCIKTFAGCVICGIIAILLNRFTPFAVGKKKNNK